MASTTTGIDKDTERKVFQLLADYKQIASFKEALALFEEKYDEQHGTDIETNTIGVEDINDGLGVRTKEEAIFFLKESNFINNKTVYKQIGLILGIDPEYYKEFRLDPKYKLTVGEKIKNFWNRDTFGFVYNNKNEFGPVVKQIAFKTNRGNFYQKNTIFVLPAVMQYFVNLGIHKARQRWWRPPPSGADPMTQPTVQDPILDFVRTNIISSILSPFIKRQFIGGVRAVEEATNFLENDIIKINELNQSLTNGNIPSLNEYERSLIHSYTYANRESSELPIILSEIIKEEGTFSNLFTQADTAINNFYDNNHTKLETYGFRSSGVTPDEMLINEQLQDILAFFNAAAARQTNDTPEASISTLAGAPSSLKQQLVRPKLTPFDFQCYLLENISKLVDQRGNANYKHVIPVTTDGDPGSIINTIQHGGKTGAVKELLNICPEVYALLVPYLKISRLDYDKFGNVATDGNGRAIISDLEIPNFLTQDDISDILSGRAGRATGAGIKSFSWSLDGVQPAEVDNNIKATLVMYFQSVNDFFNGASSAGQQTPNFLDLIINSPAVKKLKEKEGDDPEIKSCPDDLIKPELHKGYEGRNYRVKICAGWAVPDKETILELVKDDSKAKNLVEAIADSRISLFLQMTQHQISFNQNGSLELTVDYQASLAGLLSGRTADIFDETPKLIKEDIKGQEEIIDNIDDIDESNLTDSDKEKKKAALEEIKELKNIDKNVKYKKLLKNIYSADGIRFISLNPNELSMTPYKDLTPKQRQKRVKRRNNETLEISKVGTINQELIDAIVKDESRDAGEVTKAYSEVATKSFEEMMKQDKIAIPFFYLGDLLDAVIEEIKINNSNNTSDGLKPLNFNFFISDVEMIDPLLAFKAKNLEDLINCGYNLREIEFIESASKETPTKNAELNGIYKTMNIGDIPISLDAFQLWFKNNVVKKGRENYFFLYFVKDVCKEMISRALSSKCFGKEFNFEQRFDTQPLTLAKQETKISNFTPNVLTTAQKISNAKASISCDLDPTQTELGLLLYPTDSNPKNLRGDYTKDVGRGIYHHYLGSSCGLVKTINFNRQDQPYLRESRIQKEGALGAEQLRELYSANIDLVGNTLYRNGMYIYINPSLIGASQEYLDYLGLHGYYLVTAVKSTVTPNSFDVSIEALHEGIEFKGNKLQPSAFDTGDFEGLDPERAPASIDLREIEDKYIVPIISDPIAPGTDAAKDDIGATGGQATAAAAMSRGTRTP